MAGMFSIERYNLIVWGKREIKYEYYICDTHKFARALLLLLFDFILVVRALFFFFHFVDSCVYRARTKYAYTKLHRTKKTSFSYLPVCASPLFSISHSSVRFFEHFNRLQNKKDFLPYTVPENSLHEKKTQLRTAQKMNWHCCERETHTIPNIVPGAACDFKSDWWTIFITYFNVLLFPYTWLLLEIGMQHTDWSCIRWKLIARHSTRALVRFVPFLSPFHLLLWLCECLFLSYQLNR